MAPPQEPAAGGQQEDQEHPPCGHCGWPGTRSHCFNALCTWIRCGTCNLLTDVRRIGNQEGT